MAWMPGSSPGHDEQLGENTALALGELEALSGLGLAVFLALDGAGIAGQEPALLEHGAELGLVAGERLGDAMTDGAGLARKPAAAHGTDDVELALALRGDERLHQDHLQDGPRKIGDVILAVDGNLAGTPLHPDPGNRVLALAGGVGAALGVDLLLIDAGLGCGGFALQRSKIFKGHGLAHGVRRSLHSWR